MLARRSLQRLLDDGRSYLTSQQLQNVVRRLNNNNRDALETEWEVIVLAALASLGAIEHEPELGGSARLDVSFSSSERRFIADIRTVSDATYERENPVQQFADELSKVAATLRKDGIAGGFDFQVKAIQADKSAARYRTKLILPQVHQFKAVVFNQQFDDFVAAIRKAPHERRSYAVDHTEAAVSIVFTPREGGFQSFSHPAYNVANDVERNVVGRALKDKSTQIKRSGFRSSLGLVGIILCDGGCGILRALRSPGKFSLDEIVTHFLRKSSTIDFVAVLDVVDQSNYGQAEPLRFDVRLWSLRDRVWAERFNTDLKAALQKLPPPVVTPINYLNHFDWAKDRPHRLGKYLRRSNMASDSMEFSLRAVMDFLAGRIERREFESIVHEHWMTQLRKRLDDGRTIESISIRRLPDQDDDALVVEFTGYDAARSEFRAKS